MGKRRPPSPEDEYAHQRAVFNFITLMGIRYPEFKKIVGSLNGIWITGEQKWAIINKLQAAGCFNVGYPDLFWPLYRKPYSGLFIELKKKGGRMDSEQIRWQKWLTEQRFYATTSDNENETKEILMRYFEGRI